MTTKASIIRWRFPSNDNYNSWMDVNRHWNVHITIFKESSFLMLLLDDGGFWKFCDKRMFLILTKTLVLSIFFNFYFTEQTQLTDNPQHLCASQAFNQASFSRQNTIIIKISWQSIFNFSLHSQRHIASLINKLSELCFCCNWISWGITAYKQLKLLLITKKQSLRLLVRSSEGTAVSKREAKKNKNRSNNEKIWYVTLFEMEPMVDFFCFTLAKPINQAKYFLWLMSPALNPL